MEKGQVSYTCYNFLKQYLIIGQQQLQRLIDIILVYLEKSTLYVSMGGKL